MAVSAPRSGAAAASFLERRESEHALHFVKYQGLGNDFMGFETASNACHGGLGGVHGIHGDAGKFVNCHIARPHPEMTESIKNCGGQQSTDVEEPVATTTKEQKPKEIENMTDGKKGEGALFYEPPRFPGLDVPFISCDLMIGLVPPTSGTAYVYGMDIKTDMDAIYTNMGVCPQHDLLWETLTGREDLLFYGRLKNVKGTELLKAVDDSLKSVNLFHGGVGDKQVGKYSGGMKRRLSVAISLIGNPGCVKRVLLKASHAHHQ